MPTSSPSIDDVRRHRRSPPSAAGQLTEPAQLRQPLISVSRIPMVAVESIDDVGDDDYDGGGGDDDECVRVKARGANERALSCTSMATTVDHRSSLFASSDDDDRRPSNATTVSTLEVTSTLELPTSTPVRRLDATTARTHRRLIDDACR